MKIKVKVKDYYDGLYDGLCDGMSDMVKMVLTVFKEHPDYTKEQIEQYIKDNL